jgi:hypothetical protein
MGKQGIPETWLSNIIEWPKSMSWLERVGSAVAGAEHSTAAKCPTYFVPGLVLRNLVFLIIVLMHGFRRLALNSRESGQKCSQPRSSTLRR